MELRAINLSEKIEYKDKYEQALTIPCKIFLNNHLIFQYNKNNANYFDRSLDLTSQTNRWFLKPEV